MWNKKEERRKRFTESKLVSIKDERGFGIYDIKNKCFVGVKSNRGLINIWNEEKKAKLAFSYHTLNTISERVGEYEIREIVKKCEF